MIRAIVSLDNRSRIATKEEEDLMMGVALKFRDQIDHEKTLNIEVISIDVAFVRPPANPFGRRAVFTLRTNLAKELFSAVLGQLGEKCGKETHAVISNTTDRLHIYHYDEDSVLEKVLTKGFARNVILIPAPPSTEDLVDGLREVLRVVILHKADELTMELVILERQIAELRGQAAKMTPPINSLVRPSNDGYKTEAQILAAKHMVS